MRFREAEGTRFQQDKLSRKKKTDIPTSLVLAVKQTGKSGPAIAREMFQLSRAPGKITPEEYFYFRLYDDKTVSPEEKFRFLSETLQHPIRSFCNSPDWVGVTYDKFLSDSVLIAAGFPVAKTRAGFSPGQREFSRFPALKTEDDLEGFFKKAKFPLFAKPVVGKGSFGAFLIEGFKKADLQLAGGATISLKAFLKEAGTRDGYLFQDLLEPHPVIKKFSKYIATLRVILVMFQTGPEIIETVLKIPAGENVADNFWRQGNMLAALDNKRGKITRVIKGTGPDLEELENHPGSGAKILGLALPDWDKTLKMCLEAGKVFAPLKIQSYDIALTPKGPVFVEVNNGTSFILSQMASGKGMLSKTFQAFLDECGYSFKGKK